MWGAAPLLVFVLLFLLGLAWRVLLPVFGIVDVWGVACHLHAHIVVHVQVDSGRQGHGHLPVTAGEVKGVDYGLKDPDKKNCVSCHNEKSPTFKGFDFEKYVAQIAHPTPK